MSKNVGIAVLGLATVVSFASVGIHVNKTLNKAGKNPSKKDPNLPKCYGSYTLWRKVNEQKLKGKSVKEKQDIFNSLPKDELKTFENQSAKDKIIQEKYTKDMKYKNKKKQLLRKITYGTTFGLIGGYLYLKCISELNQLLSPDVEIPIKTIPVRIIDTVYTNQSSDN